MARKKDFLYKAQAALEEAESCLHKARHAHILVNNSIMKCGNSELLTLLAEHMPSAVERAYVLRQIDINLDSK